MRAYLFAWCITSSLLWAPAQAKAVDAHQPGNAQNEAEALLNRARELSDVRKTNAPSKIAESGGKAFDKLAVEAVSRWRFKPASCSGAPMATQINVEVTFRSFR